MGAFNPTEEELKEMGCSRRSYFEHSFALHKVLGILKAFKPCMVLHHLIHNLLIACVFGFTVGTALEGEKDDVLEGIQNMLIMGDIYIGCAVYNYFEDDVLQLFRSLEEDLFDYEDTLDQQTIDDITQMRARTVRRKKWFKMFYSINMLSIIAGQLAKKPIFYLVRGGGVRAVDGMNGLIRNAPLGIYVPFGYLWIPYVLGITFGNIYIVYLCFSGIAYAIIFQFISEDLLFELAVVDRTLGRVVERAEELHSRSKQTDFETNGIKSLETFEDCLRHCLKLSIKHHQRTLRLFATFRGMISYTFFAIVVSWAIIVCVSVYLILNSESLEVKLPLPALILSECVCSGIFCHYGELLKEAKLQVARSIMFHGEKWVKYSLILKPYVLIVSSYSSIPNTLTAGGFAAADYPTYLHFLSTAYSYMGFLLSS